ncbi:unnamed protein product [Closterium sp. NIES-54]
MVGSPTFISNSKHMRRPCEITVANNGRLQAYDIGEICLEAEDTRFTIHIGNVLVFPDLQYNLLSSAQLMRCGVDIRSNCQDNTFELYYKNTYIGKAGDDKPNTLTLARTRLLKSSFATVKDHFLALDPTDLSVDLLEKHLLATETSVVAVGAARGTPCTPFFEGCSPSPLPPPTLLLLLLTSLVLRMSGLLLLLVGSAAAARARVARVVAVAAGVMVVEAVEAVEVAQVVAAVGVVAEVGDSVAVVVAVVGVGVAVVAAVGVVAVAVVAVGVELFRGEVLAVARGSSRSIEARPLRPSSFVSGLLSVGRPRDAILAAMYALSVSAEGDCYLCVPPDPGIEAAALGASEAALPGTAPAKALHTFTLDSSASRCFFRDSTTLTPLPAPVPVPLADPSGGPILARSSTILPCPAVPSGSLSGLHVPSFSTNLVSTTALQDAMVTTTTPWGQHVLICTCTWTGRHLATFTRRPGSSQYTLIAEPPRVDASAQVSASGPVAAPCSCRLLSHQTLLWHHRLGHPSLPRLHSMHSRLLVSGFPRSLPPLPPSPNPPCLPCVEGRQRAAPHSSSFPLTTAPLQTLHMDIRAVRLQLRERFHKDLPVLCLHSDRGGEFSSHLLRDFSRGEGILQSFTLLASPQQNGVAERRIGLVMEVARTSMIHAVAPHFLWPFAVRYAAHQLNLLHRVSLPKTSPTLRWTEKVGDAMVFWVWGSRAFFCDTSAEKLSSRAIPYVFLGFPLDAPGWRFYHLTSRRVLPSQDVTFDESFPFYHLFPYRTAPLPPLLLFLAPGPPPIAVDSGAARGAASGGAESEGAESRGVEPEGAEPGGTEPEGAEPGGADSGGADSGGAEPRGAEGPADGGTGAGGARATSPGGAGVLLGPEVSKVLELLVLEVLVLKVLELPELVVLEALELETLELEALALEALELEELELETLELKALELEALELEALELVALELETLELEVLALGVLELAVLPDSPLPAPSPYAEQTDSLTKRREPESRLASPVRDVRTGRRVPCLRPPPVPGTHIMALRPSSVPLRVPLPSPPASSLPDDPHPESALARGASPTVPRLLATAVTNPSFESIAASSLVAELVDFAAASRLDYTASLVAESEFDCPPSVGGECALGTDVLEDRQEDFECLAAAVPHLVAMLFAPEGDPDAPDIPTPSSYAEAIEGPYSSQWQTAMDAEIASLKSTSTYFDAVPPSGVNIVDDMWIFPVKWPPGSLPVFKARYAA